MSRTDEEMVAYSLEVASSLLPFIPELLADLDELGSDAELIVEVLGDLGLGDRGGVTDLGCGKGATAVEIAGELGCRVLGIDLFEPFIRACERAAAAAGVADLCHFRHGNILELAGMVEPADVVIFSALGDVLGTLDETVGVIRQYAKPSGLILIGDGYLEEGVTEIHPGFEGYVDRAETIRRLTTWGDSLVREVPERGSGEPGSEDESLLIRARAERLATEYPELRQQLIGFAEEQAAEYRFLRESFVGTLWVLRKSGDGEGARHAPRRRGAIRS